MSDHREDLRNALIDVAALLVDLTTQLHDLLSGKTIEHLAQDVAAWDALYQRTRAQLALQQEAHRRLLATLAPLADRHPDVAAALRKQP